MEMIVDIIGQSRNCNRDVATIVAIIAISMGIRAVMDSSAGEIVARTVIAVWIAKKNSRSDKSDYYLHRPCNHTWGECFLISRTT